MMRRLVPEMVRRERPRTKEAVSSQSQARILSARSLQRPCSRSWLAPSAHPVAVAIGAHHGYPNLLGIWTTCHPLIRSEFQGLVAYQIGALAAVAKLAVHCITDVKAHGALEQLVADNSDAANSFADVRRAIDLALMMSVMDGSKLEKASLDAATEGRA